MCCVAVLQLLVYGVFVGIPDFLSDSVALSTNGGIQNSPPESLAALVVVALGLTILIGRRFGRYEDLHGTTAVTVGIAAGLALLLLQGSGKWTYYPAKFAWLSSILLLMIIAAALTQLLVYVVTRSRLVVVGSIVSLVVVAAVAIKSPPPTHNLLLGLTPLGSALSGQARHQDRIAARLFSLSDPGHKILVSRYSTDVADDEFMNLWLLQATSQKGTERIRDFAYGLVPTSAEQVCEAITAWGGPVTVGTTVRGWGAKLRATCQTEYSRSISLSDVRVGERATPTEFTRCFDHADHQRQQREFRQDRALCESTDRKRDKHQRGPREHHAFATRGQQPRTDECEAQQSDEDRRARPVRVETTRRDRRSARFLGTDHSVWLSSKTGKFRCTMLPSSPNLGASWFE